MVEMEDTTVTEGITNSTNSKEMHSWEGTPRTAVGQMDAMTGERRWEPRRLL